MEQLKPMPDDRTWRRCLAFFAAALILFYMVCPVAPLRWADLYASYGRTAIIGSSKSGVKEKSVRLYSVRKPQRAAQDMVDAVDGLRELFLFIDKILDKGEQRSGAFRERDAVGAPDKKRDAGLFFERADGVADTGLCIVQDLRGPGDVAGFGGLYQNLVTVQIHGNSITFLNGGN